MHKTFYASGFLYRPQSQQILLQQLNDSVPRWSLFGNENSKFSDPSDVIKHLFQSKLGIKLSSKKIHSVYDYVDEKIGKDHFVLYAEVAESAKNIKPRKGFTTSWFNFKQLYKLPLTAQAKQDIIVGERVIKAIARDLENPVENKKLVDES